MKSQTKAFLASVMVLALALSSIGGVTYSWFSDVETGNIEIGTAETNVYSSLSVFSTAGYNGVNCNGMNLTINPSGTATITLTVKNGSTIPVDVTAKVIIPRHQALLDTNPYTHVGELILGEDGSFVKDPIIWGSYFNGAKNNLKFNDTELKFKSTKYTPVNVGQENPEYNLVRSGYYYYDIGNFSLPKYTATLGIEDPQNDPNIPKGEISFNIWVGEGFVKEAMPEIRIDVSCTQSKSSIGTIDGENTSIEITDPLKPLHLIGEGFIIGINEETLTNVTSISVDISKNPSLKVTLTYLKKDGSSNRDVTENVSGNVTIIFSHNGISGSLIAPAKDGSYVLYTFATGTGGSS